MLNIADTLHRWCREARPFALATVVDVRGSAPLPDGTSVAVDEDGNAAGSISGGCVEGAVYELCRQVLRDRGTPQRVWFGYSYDDAFAVGLTCGGELDVLVQRSDPAAQPHLSTALFEIDRGRPVAVAQVVDGPERLLGSTPSVLGCGRVAYGRVDGGPADRAVADRAGALLRAAPSAPTSAGRRTDVRSSPSLRKQPSAWKNPGCGGPPGGGTHVESPAGPFARSRSPGGRRSRVHARSKVSDTAHILSSRPLLTSFHSSQGFARGVS